MHKCICVCMWSTHWTFQCVDKNCYFIVTNTIFHCKNLCLLIFIKLIFRDLRANLELAVEHVIELASNPENTLDNDYTSDSEGAPVVLCNVKLTSAVRKRLAISIRDLMQHGLMPVSTF